MPDPTKRGLHSFLQRAKVTVDPNEAWSQFQETIIVDPVAPKDAYSLKPDGHIRFVCISDTHGSHGRMEIPPGDVLLHAGDFTRTGTAREVKSFADFMESLPHRHKIVIAGNHDLTMDLESYEELWLEHRHSHKYDAEALKTYLKERCTYLEDEAVEVEGFTIYGTPWQPKFMHWGFNLERGEECQIKWDAIPANVDILLTHTPPLGHGDRLHYGARAGCVNLLDTVEGRVQPRVHVFGHIHEDYGITTNGTTMFINAASCDLTYKPVNPPIVFDLPSPLQHHAATVQDFPVGSNETHVAS